MLKYNASQETHRGIPSPSLTPEEAQYRYLLAERNARSATPPSEEPSAIFTPFSKAGSRIDYAASEATSVLRTTLSSDPRISSSSPSFYGTRSASSSTPNLSHLTSSGAAHMISITSKSPTHRTASATCTILFSNPSAHIALAKASLKKGDAIAVARVGGIMAAKKTADLIPLAHPSIGITGVNIDVDVFQGANGRVALAEEEQSNDRAKRIWKREEPIQRDGPDLSFACGEHSRSHLTIINPSSGKKCAFHAGASPTSYESKFGGVQITATVECDGKTGVEMEALAAASVAGLTIYDMCKGVDKGMVMQGVRVMRKTGGKSGGWKWDEHTQSVQRIPNPSSAATLTADARSAADAPSTSTTLAQAAEMGQDRFNSLLLMHEYEFMNEYHHTKRKFAMLEQVFQERVEQKVAKVRKHVKTRQDEVECGERGRVDQEAMEKQRWLRRKRYEASAGGSILMPEYRQWMLGPKMV